MIINTTVHLFCFPSLVLPLFFSKKLLVDEPVIVEDKNGDKIKINQFSASEIVMSRLEEILNLAKKQINLLTKKQISYIIITGGVTETAEFKNIVDYIFKNAIIG